jgi:predicted dehydrogenase
MASPSRRLPDDAIRIGLVGCGRLAERGWLPAIAATDGVELVAVADRDGTRRALAPPSAARFRDAAELVAAENVDALVVATPASHHLAHARVAAEARVPCLVEKPPAADLADAIRIAELDPAPWIGFNRRFEPAIAALRAAIPASGRLDIQVGLRYRRRGWSPHEVRDDALLDLGPHAIDLGRWLSGAEIVRVRAGRLAPHSARFELELDRDRGSVSVECATDRPWRERLAVGVEGGHAVGRVAAGGLVRGVGERLRPPAQHPLVASLSRELVCFAAAVRGEPDDPIATARDGVAVMAGVEGARLSASARGAWTPVPAPEPLSMT